MAKALLIILACVILAGCQTTRGSFCPLGPFIPDDGASTRWTENEQDQLIVRNEVGEDTCGWKAP